MKRRFTLRFTLNFVFCATASVLMLCVTAVRAASPSVANALKLNPVQNNVNYDKPSDAEASKCKIAAHKSGKSVGWAVTNPSGMLLRVFLDTNGDDIVDQWRYFKDGLEVYRDVDSNFNRKADQFHWFHTAGSRWAVDEDEDGHVDRWKRISAEELSAEAVAALADRDAQRFMSLVISPAELQSLGLGEKKRQRLAAKISRLRNEFQSLSDSNSSLPRGSEWVQFSGVMPGIVPSGTDGSSKDIAVYENATAMVRSEGKHSEVLLGTLVKVGDAWRMLHLPRTLDSGQMGAEVTEFFSPAAAGDNRSAPGEGMNQQAQKLAGQLEQLDKAIAAASGKKRLAELNERRADIVEQIAATASNASERAMWLRQLADMVSAAAQEGSYPQGEQRLAALFEKCKRRGDKDLAAYVRFKQLTAAYVLSMQVEKPDFQKIQERWLASLEQFVKDYPQSSDAAEAMLQLAIANEFAGEEEKAKRWYARVVKEFPDAPVSKKAQGARRRLDCVGKPLSLRGRAVSGKPVDIERYRGKAVLVQYWATWSTPARTAMSTLRELASKYPGSFQVVGVNLDNSLADLKAYLEENELPWPQIFESGGLDSRPANELGILSVPTMVLLDKQGRVISRNIALGDLDDELKKLLGPSAARRKSHNGEKIR